MPRPLPGCQPDRLKGENQLPKVVRGVTFRDGVEVTDTPAQTAA